MNSTTMKAGVLLMSVLAILGAVAALGMESDAAGEDLSGTYGEPSVINIAPGYSYTYTATFPSDLTADVVLSTAVNDFEDYGAQYVVITGHQVKVTIPTNAEPGSYNLVLKADHAPSGQTAYQYIQFNVGASLSVSGTINDIVKGTSVDLTPSASGGVGAITWSVNGELPDGLSWNGSKVTGVPTGVGEQTVSLKATTANGESKDLVITFTVWNAIKGGSDETITAIGSTPASSTGIVQDGEDINVTWAVTSGDLPEGFTLDPATGVVSGYSTDGSVVDTTVTLTGTATAGPSQTATKNVTIHAEPAITLSGDSSILTYVGNAESKTVTVTPSGTSSAIAWGVTELAGVTIENGTVTVTGSAAAQTSTEVTVTATTAYGQTVSHTISLTVEDTLTISGDSTLTGTVGTPAHTAAFEVTGGSGNQMSVSGLAGASVADGVLTVQSASPVSATEVTITVTSAAGQTATHTVTVTIYNSLIFNNDPSTGVIAWAV